MMSSYSSGCLESRDPWNGKSAFPNFKVFAPDSESSKPDESDIAARQNIPYPSKLGRASYQGLETSDCYASHPARKWSDEDLENYFTHMRITPRLVREIVTPTDIDVNIVRPNSKRPETYRGYDRESPGASSPNDTEGSVSSESIGASSGNTLNSVNGSVGNVPERNKVHLERIRLGLDKRTTIMIKNVPNKYTQVQLVAFEIDDLIVAYAYGVY